jgi:hypothetical protein
MDGTGFASISWIPTGVDVDAVQDDENFNDLSRVRDKAFGALDGANLIRTSTCRADAA